MQNSDDCLEHVVTFYVANKHRYLSNGLLHQLLHAMAVDTFTITLDTKT